MLDQRMEGTAPSVRTLAEVDLCEVANQLADDASRLLVLAGAQLDIGWLPVVRADPDAMYSVLQNLLTNAVKFTRAGVGPRLSLSSSRVRTGRRTSMTDNGIGIPAHAVRMSSPRSPAPAPARRVTGSAWQGRPDACTPSGAGSVPTRSPAAAPTCVRGHRHPMHDSLATGGCRGTAIMACALHG